MNISKNKFNKIRIIIVGSGIIGKFTALELSNYGFDITLVDKDEKNNSSNAALGILMGKIYQKRKGRSWELRKRSLELWPKWLKILQEFNPKLRIEKPLVQLTTDPQKFEKLRIFANNYPNEGLEIIQEKSHLLDKTNEIFLGNSLQGIISHHDGRINPAILLKTLNIAIGRKKIKIIRNAIIDIKKIRNQWWSSLEKGEHLTSEIVILCNSLDAIKIIKPNIFGIKLKPVLGQAIEVLCNDDNINFLSLPKQLNINGKNLIPISKQQLLIGSTDEYHTKPSENQIKELLNFIENKPYWLNKNNISKRWFGVRSRPEGEPSPLLKTLDEGLLLCSGFYKNGFLLAPSCSEWVREKIMMYI
tara:strand:+ start:3903 stop:4982 length:1080 start_codon:yes stop_codon:yes gene_type:complete